MGLEKDRREEKRGGVGFKKGRRTIEVRKRSRRGVERDKQIK